MRKEKLDERVLAHLGISSKKPIKLGGWTDFLGRLKHTQFQVSIALVGKYVRLKDSYMSIHEALRHAGAHTACRVDIKWIEAESLDKKNIDRTLGRMHGILVAPGFGSRGVEGKILAVQYARMHHIPFFGICLGMQCAVIECAQNLIGEKRAHSTEIKPRTPMPVISLMNNQKKRTNKGGTMRLGIYPCQIKKGSKAFDAYKQTHIQERHRHRYEFNNAYLKKFEAIGMETTGINPSGLTEIVELKQHPWFLGCQFHPEYNSSVLKPHALFTHFIQAAQKQKN